MKRTVLLAAVAACLSFAGPAVAWSGDCAKGTGPKAWYRDGGYCDVAADMTGTKMSGHSDAEGGVFYAGVVPGGTVMVVNGQTVTYFVGYSSNGVPIVEPLAAFAQNLRQSGASAGTYTYPNGGGTTLTFDGQHVTSATWGGKTHNY